MKNYLLKPHKRLEIVKKNGGDVWLVRANGLQDCWRFIKDKYFLCIHFIFDKDRMLRTISQEDINDVSKILSFIKYSDIHFGILTKRGNASIKSMLKVYKLDEEFQDLSDKGIPDALGCPGSQIGGINTTALMLRMELYVDEYRWHSLDVGSQADLNGFIQ
jgi:hypothetical protein